MSQQLRDTRKLMSMFRPSNRTVKTGSRHRIAKRRELSRRIACEQLEGRLMMAADVSPLQNQFNETDVNDDGHLNPMDGLIVINLLNSVGATSVPTLLASSARPVGAGGEGESQKLPFYDTTGDNWVTPADVLRVFNEYLAGEAASTMTYTLRTFNEAGTQEISSVGVGQKFLLRAFVRDNRVLGNFPNGTPREGVFAAYLDVKYTAAQANVSGAIVHNINDFGQAPNANTTADGIIDGAGSFRGSLTPTGRNEFLLWSLPMTAEGQGTITFTGEPTTDPADTAAPPQGDQGQSPSLDTGVYGEDKPICPSSASCVGSMGFTNATLNVVTDVSAANDSFTVAEDAPATPATPAVTANDSVLNPVGAAPTIIAVTQGSNGATVTFTASNVSYRPAANFNGTDTFTYTVSNGPGGTSTATATVTVTVTAANDAPVVTVPGAQSIGEDATLAFNTANNRKVSVADADGDVNVQTTLTVNNGRLTVPSTAGVTITGNNTGSVQLTGAISAINAALDNATGLVYQPNANFDGSDTLTVTANDQGNTGGAALSDTKTVAITITSANDAPQNTVPAGTVSTDEDVPLTFSTANGNALSVSDADSGNSPIAVRLSIDQAQAGTLNLASTNGLTVTGNGTATINITGTASAIATALGAGLTFTPTAGFITQQSIVFTMRSDDQGATGSGGAQVDTDTFNIDVVPTVRPRAVNDSATVAEDTTAGVTVNVLANDKPHTGTSATLLSFTQPAAGGVVTLVDNGTPANNTDDQLRFVPNANFAGNATFTYTINDTTPVGDPNRGADSTATVTVTVSAVNDGPVNTVPGAQNGTEDTAIVINGISVADIDAGSGNIEVNLSATNGKINVTAGGATATNNGTSSVKLTGTLTAVNAALAAGVTYTGNLNFSGADTVTVATSDLGSTGSPGALTDTDTIAITIAAVNDPPVNTVPGAQTAFKDQDFVFSAANNNALQTSDADAGNNNVQVTLSVPSGTLTVGNTAGVTAGGNGTATVSLTGTVTAINAALAAGLTFRPGAGATGNVTLTMVTNDQGNTGGAAQSDTDTVVINVQEFVASTIGGGVFADVNANGVRDATELGLANVLITLQGQDIFGVGVNLQARTDTNGRFSFNTLKPGTYTLIETQPAAMRDGSDQIGTGLAAAGNDRATITIVAPGGVSSTNTLFGELGLEATFIRAGDFLLASSGRPDQASGVLFGHNSVSDWFVLDDGTTWGGFDNARFSIVNRNGVHATVTLTARHIATNTDRTVTINSEFDSRLMIIDDGGDTVIRFKGRPEDLFVMAGGEGEASSMSDYSQGVDEVMREVAEAVA
jgi:VCBS repeat-containing protein